MRTGINDYHYTITHSSSTNIIFMQKTPPKIRAVRAQKVKLFSNSNKGVRSTSSRCSFAEDAASQRGRKRPALTFECVLT